MHSALQRWILVGTLMVFGIAKSANGVESTVQPNAATPVTKSNENKQDQNSQPAQKTPSKKSKSGSKNLADKTSTAAVVPPVDPVQAAKQAAEQWKQRRQAVMDNNMVGARE